MNRTLFALGLGVIAFGVSACSSGGRPASSSSASTASVTSGSSSTGVVTSTTYTTSYVPPVPTSVAAVGSDWTLLFYANGNNNLEAALLAEVIALESVGSTANVTVLVEIETGTIPFGTPSDHLAKRFMIRKSSDPTQVTSPTLVNLGDIDGTSPDEIAKFVAWGRQSFPSQHYGLFLDDHSGSWTGYGEDVAHNQNANYPKLAALISESGQALGQKFDDFGIQACLGTGIEVQMLLSAIAKVGIGFEDFSVSGFNWERALPILEATPTMDGVALAQALVTGTTSTAYTTPVNPSEQTDQGDDTSVCAAIDLSKVQAIVDAVKEFAARNVNSPTVIPALAAARERSLSLGVFDQRGNDGFLVNLADLANQLSLTVQDASLTKIQTAVQAAVIAKTASLLRTRATGLSVYYPTLGFQANWTAPLDMGNQAGLYSETAFAKATGWDQVVSAVFQAAVSETSVPPGTPAPFSIVVSAANTTLTAGGSINLPFTIQSPATALLRQTLFSPIDANNWRSMGTVDLLPTATAMNWDGTALYLTDGTNTVPLDFTSLLPGASLAAANATLFGSNGSTAACVIVQLDDLGNATLVEIDQLSTDPASGIQGLSVVTAPYLAGQSLTLDQNAFDANGVQTGTLAAGTLSATNLTIVRQPVPSGSYALGLTFHDGLGGIAMPIVPVTAQ